MNHFNLTSRGNDSPNDQAITTGDPPKAERTPLSFGKMIVVAILTAFCAASLIIALHVSADLRRRDEIQLQRIDSRIHELGLVEETAYAEHQYTLEMAQRVGEINRDLTSMLVQFRTTKTGAAIQPVSDAVTDFSAKLHAELDLISSGQPAAAELYAQSYTDPALREAKARITVLDRSISRKATLFHIIADIGTLFILMLAAVGAVFALRRIHVTLLANDRLSIQADARRRSEARYSAMLRNATDITLIVGDDGRVKFQTAAMETVFGHRADSLHEQSLIGYVHPSESTRIEALLSGIAQSPGGTVETEVRIRDANGSFRPAEVTITNMTDVADVGGLVVTCRDITDRKKFEGQILHQAFHDALTGLPNRALFRERIVHAIERAKRGNDLMAVLFLDLDNFKNINDTLGHEAGDILLVETARRLQTCTRGADTVARLGGDEFTVLLEEVTDESEARIIAERIVEAIRKPVNLAGRDYLIGGSVGLVFGSGQYADADELLRDADTAMYQAKGHGKGKYVVFEQSMNADIVRRVELETALRRGVANGEFEMYYQPIVDLQTSAVVEFEALLRWNHPSRGVLLPAEFIVAAEETGLIVPLGMWALEESCREAAKWRDALTGAKSPRVSVNMSARQLIEADFVEKVAAALRSSGLPGELLKLEITETVMMQDTANTIPKMNQLRELGIRIAIDDFGIGYSSMAYISTLPVDTLKIDQSFVDKMRTQNEDIAIVGAIVTLAKTLNLVVTSEGIETREQLDLLTEMGCEEGQGYHLARPMPAADVWSCLDLPRPASLSVTNKRREAHNRQAA
ncbi:MAG TPA: EAL domain-containing protein [Capsulimonadaceae bacterium]|jgi:diguanylate cyclase (GGDEF)-like protein/PAS domain S-box-containing protein